MPSSPRPRTVLEVARNNDGDVVITLVVDDLPERRTHSLTIQSHDVVVLIELLRQYLDDDPEGHDPEDSTTARSLRPITA